MSKNGSRKRNRRKNKNEDNSRDDLYDDFLSMFGESVDPIEIFNVLERNKWNAESSVDELMNMPKKSESGKPSIKPFTSMYEQHHTSSSKSPKSSQNLNYYNFSPNPGNNSKSNVKQYNGFHDIKVVYKGENSEDEADADIIIEEENDVYNGQGPKVLHNEFTVPFQKNAILNACASSSSSLPASSITRVRTNENNPKTLNSDYEKFNIDNVAFQKNVITQKYSPHSAASNITEIKPQSINVIYQECLEIVDSLDRISSLVLNSIKVMVLLRGCPGSGKSFTAEKIILNVNNIRPYMKLKLKDHIFSTDDYFMSPKHGYKFDGQLLPQAHDWNKNRALKAVSGNVNPVIIDNTNTQIWEMAAYVQLGVKFGYVVEVLEPETKWKFNEYELFRRNIHGVARGNIRNMLERYEHGIARNNILQMLNCQYHSSKQPPQIVPGQRINGSNNLVKDNAVHKPSKSNGWPPSTLHHSDSSSSVSSDGQSVERKYQTNHSKNNSSGKDNNYSNLTPSCRTFFEKSLLSSVTVAGTEATIDDSKLLPIMKNDTTNESGVKKLKEHNDGYRAPSRNALLCNMFKDYHIPDVVAKTPNVPLGWLTFNKPAKDDDVENAGHSSVDLIDFGSSKNVNSTTESEDANQSDTIEDGELSEVTGMMSKLTVDNSKQSHLLSACSSDNPKTSGDDSSDKSMLPALKDINSQNIENHNSALDSHSNVTLIEHPRCEPANLDEKVSENATANTCLMDEVSPTPLQSIDLMSCISISEHSSKFPKNAVLAQLSDTSTSQSVDPVHDSKFIHPKEDQNEKTSSMDDLAGCQESSQSFKTITSTTEIEEDKCNDFTFLKEPCQEQSSTINELSSETSEQVLNLENDEKNSETSIQKSSPGSVEINESENEACSIVSNPNVENKLPSNFVSNEQVGISNIDIKAFKFTATKLGTQNSSGTKKDLFFSELKDDPVDDYFNDSEISQLLQSLEDLDLKFISDEETDSSKEPNNEMEKLVSLEGVEPRSSSPTDVPENHSSLPPNETTFTSISDGNNICKPIDGSEQSNVVESVETSDVRDQLNSSSSITLAVPESNLVVTVSTSDESDDLNTSSSMRILSDSYMTVAEDSNSDSLYFDVESVEIEGNELTNLDYNVDSDICNINHERGTDENEEKYVGFDETVNSNEKDDELENVVKTVTQTSVIGEECANKNYEDDSHEVVNSNEECATKNYEDDSHEVVNSNEECATKNYEDGSHEVVNSNEECATKNYVDGSHEVVNSNEECATKNYEDGSHEVVNSNEECATKIHEDDCQEVVNSKGKDDKLENVVETVPQRLVTDGEAIDKNVDEETDDSYQLLNSKENDVVETVESQSLADEEPVHFQEHSHISIDGVKALIKGGAAVKTFDVMSWLKNNFIKESSEGSSGIEHFLSDSEHEVTQPIENVVNNETTVDDESGNLNSQCSNPLSKLSNDNTKQLNDDTAKPSRNIERTGPAQQNYSIIGSTQSNNEKSRKRDKFLVWGSVDEPENSWAETMKNTLGTSDAEDGHIPKPQRLNNNNNIQHENSDEELEPLPEGPFLKVIDILSRDVEQTGEQIETSKENESFSQKLQELSNLFPESQSIYLEELLRQCQGDINWAAGLLLEGGCEISAEAYSSKKDVAPELFEISRKSADVDTAQASCSKSNSKKQKKEKKNAHNNMSEARMELKKMVEQNFVLSETSYSEHLLKLLKFRRGEMNPEYDAAVEMSDTDGIDPETLYPAAGCHPVVEEQFEEAEFFDQESQNAEGITEDEGSLEFVFNKDVITTLSYNFGSAGFPLDMTGVRCPVKLPMRLARELHSYWMDSVEEYLSNENSRMQMMIKEDEELAKRLQQEEEEASAVTPNLQQVIDFETALMLHEADLKKTREVQGNDSTVAAKLAMSILIEKYPNEKEEVLTELLRSNNYSLHNTLSLLKMINEREQSQEQEMADNVKHELDDCDGSSVFEESETLQSSYERCREEAKTHFFKRNEYFQKAQHEYTSGNKAAASFYSQLANMHMKKMEDANCRAATLLLSTSKTTQNTLDLHFYQVKEAVQVLDIFIDASMTRLEESRKPKLKTYIITGRGLHSVSGKSAIKPIVVKRLRQRNIRHHEDEKNPGAIICTLTRHS